MKTSRIFIYALLIFLICPFKIWAEASATLVKVIDGDTLKVRYSGKIENVRLIGIDTPERLVNDKAIRDSKRTHKDLATITSNGQKAADYMARLVKPGEELRLEFDAEKRDHYGRLLAYVYRKSGGMLNEQMISDGFAGLLTKQPNVKYVKRFQAAHTAALNEGKGLWR